MALSESEKQKVMFHLGYPATASGVTIGASIAFSTELSQLAIFAIEKLTDDGETRVRMIISTMDGIESKMTKAQSRLAVSKVETISIRTDEIDALEDEYKRWQSRLANTIGCYVADYKYSSSGGINVPRVMA